jgi:hypothetical protein
MSYAASTRNKLAPLLLKFRYSFQSFSNPTDVHIIIQVFQSSNHTIINNFI